MPSRDSGDAGLAVADPMIATRSPHRAERLEVVALRLNHKLGSNIRKNESGPPRIGDAVASELAVPPAVRAPATRPSARFPFRRYRVISPIVRIATAGRGSKVRAALERTMSQPQDSKCRVTVRSVLDLVAGVADARR